MTTQTKIMNVNDRIELLKVENQWLKTQLRRESESKQLMALQLQAVSEECITLQQKITNNFMQQVQTVQNPLMPFSYGPTISAQIQNLALSSNNFNNGHVINNNRKRTISSNNSDTDSVGSLKKSRSFAQAKKQLNNSSTLSMASTVSSSSSVSTGSDFATLANTASTLLPDYLRTLQIQANINLLSLNKLSCLLCQKKGLECSFVGRSKVCLNCKRSKKKCERIQVSC